jgi:hypothetical protein
VKTQHRLCAFPFITFYLHSLCSYKDSKNKIILEFITTNQNLTYQNMADYWTLQQQQQLLRNASRRPSILACIDESGNIDVPLYIEYSRIKRANFMNQMNSMFRSSNGNATSPMTIPPSTNNNAMDLMSTSLHRRSSLTSANSNTNNNSLVMGPPPQFPSTGGGLGMNINFRFNNNNKSIITNEMITRLALDAAAAKQRQLMAVSPPSASPVLGAISGAAAVGTNGSSTAVRRISNPKPLSSLRQDEVDAAEALLFSMGRRSSNASGVVVVAAEKRNDEETTMNAKAARKKSSANNSSGKTIPKKKKQKIVKVKKSTFDVPKCSTTRTNDHHMPLKKRMKVE